jgi:orotidine-5'-phosphate decarboxylase
MYGPIPDTAKAAQLHMSAGSPLQTIERSVMPQSNNGGGNSVNPSIPIAERLIVALDYDTWSEAIELVDLLGDSVSFYKVGWQLFMGSHFYVPDMLAKRGKKVFLDLKIEDIPNTVYRAMRNVKNGSLEHIKLMTVNGSSALIKTVLTSLEVKPRLLMLTALSSMDDEDARKLFGPEATIEVVVAHRAKNALNADCDGLIASGDSVKMLRSDPAIGFVPLIVTPGIRFDDNSKNDHKRSLTPFEAARDGADHLVVGRPIREAHDPRAAVSRVVADIRKGLLACSRPASTDTQQSADVIKRKGIPSNTVKAVPPAAAALQDRLVASG